MNLAIRSTRLLAAFLFAALLASPSLAQSLTRAQREQDVRQLIDVVRRTYAYVEVKRDRHGVDLDKLLADGLARAGQIESDAEFHDLLKELVAGLKDGHCEIHAPNIQPQRPRLWPFDLDTVKDGVMVRGVRLSPGSRPTLARGDLVVEINGRPVERWVADAARPVSASSDGTRRRLAVQRLGATADPVVEVTARRGAETLRLRLPTVAWEPPAPPKERPKFAEGRVLKPGIGYVRVPSFGWSSPEFSAARTDAESDRALEPARREIDTAFRVVGGTEALVLDLRGNGGGLDRLAVQVLSHFRPESFVYHWTQTRQSPELRTLGFTHLKANHGWAPKYSWKPRETVFTFYKGPAYEGRLIVLTDEICFSATDGLLMALADLHPGVRFVGRPAHGGSGGPTPIASLLHSKASVQVCVMQVWSPKGRLIEGNGVRPDVPVEWTRDDVLAGRDPDLEAALRECAVREAVK